MILSIIAAFSFLFFGLNAYFENTLRHIDTIVSEDQTWSRHGRELSNRLSSLASKNRQIKLLAQTCEANPKALAVGLAAVQSLVIERDLLATVIFTELQLIPEATGADFTRVPLLACGRSVQILGPQNNPFAEAEKAQSGFRIIWSSALSPARWAYSNSRVTAL
jgi:hypothetical protein